MTDSNQTPRPIPHDRRLRIVVTAACVAQAGGLAVAAGRLDAAAVEVASPTPAHVAGVLLVAAALLLASGLLLQVVGPTQGRRSPGPVTLGLAGYLAVGPLASLLVGHGPAVPVGRAGQALALLAVGAVLLGRARPGRRELAVLAPLVTLVVLVAADGAWRQPLDATDHLLTGGLLSVGWAVVAVGTARRLAPGEPPPASLVLVLAVGTLPVLRGLDGPESGTFALLAAGLVLLVATAHLVRSWAGARRSAGAALAVVRAAEEEGAARTSALVHDARNTCAVVRMAVDLLTDEDHLDRDTALRLRQAAVGSLDQLEGLVVAGSLRRTA
ncbi:hypothetical protein [Nocardioides litoris]|uniref:hypothetical protein n=1 Tax=Nocardioides litoris TaxID=1926648 RepID=UPI0014773F08|nr:hypothetical protein [Nocardioides litoris]